MCLFSCDQQTLPPPFGAWVSELLWICKTFFPFAKITPCYNQNYHRTNQMCNNTIRCRRCWTWEPRGIYPWCWTWEPKGIYPWCWTWEPKGFYPWCWTWEPKGICPWCWTWDACLGKEWAAVNGAVIVQRKDPLTKTSIIKKICEPNPCIDKRSVRPTSQW